MEVIAIPCLLFIFSGVLCAIIRWFHMCRPYNARGDYFYPARRLVSMSYLGTVLLFPYVLHPYDADTWLYTQVFGVVYWTAAFALSTHRYFFMEADRHKWWARLTRPLILIVSIALIFSLLPSVMGGGKNDLLPYVSLIKGLTIAVAGSVSVALVASILRIIRAIRRNMEDNYSNLDEFPLKFAQRIIWLPVVGLSLMWFLFLAGSPQSKSYIDVCCIVMHVVVLLVILHPQKVNTIKSPADEKEEAEELDEAVEQAMSLNREDSCNMSAERLQEYERQIVKLMEGELLFLRPDFSATELQQRLGCSHDTLSRICKELDGSFYLLVNRYRLHYAEQYATEHPNLKKEEIARASGFGSLVSMRRAAKRLNEPT